MAAQIWIKECLMKKLNTFILEVRRDKAPAVKAAAKWMLAVNLPVPHALKPLGRIVYELRLLLPAAFRRLKSLLWSHPLFACRCEAIGKGLELWATPCVRGHASIYVGSNVRFSGNLAIQSGRFYDHPVLRIGDRSFLGHHVSITCNREVIIEEDVLIAGDCSISDYDGHPSDPGRRLDSRPPDSNDVRPVRICRGAWIGAGSVITKGVTVGEGAVVGARSVVTHDVPSYSVAAGSPARVVKQNAPIPAPARAPEFAIGCLVPAAVILRGRPFMKSYTYSEDFGRNLGNLGTDGTIHFSATCAHDQKGGTVSSLPGFHSELPSFEHRKEWGGVSLAVRTK
jgi:acetyltransferase-like isoleucine patch superfamily enzyme